MKTHLLCAAVALACTGPAAAFTFESGGISGNFDSWLTLGTGIRTSKPACDTIIGFIGGEAAPPSGAGAPAGCIDAGGGTNDQGNLNYRRGRPFTTYLNGLHELLLKMPEGWKFFGRVNWRADASATHTTGYLSALQGGVGESQPGGADKQLRFKARLLDFWVSKDFALGGERARVRLGNQVVSWGESLFLPGGIDQTNAMDLMRLSQPGVQLKEVALPAPILSFATGLGHGLNIEAYVQGHWNSHYFPPIGSYFSVATVGTGAAAFGAAVGSNIPTRGEPSDGGQYGMALRYQPAGTEINLGLFAMRYHDKAPVLGFSDPLSEGDPGVHWSYLEGRKLLGISANFPVGNWAVGAELSYRPKDPITLQVMPNEVDGGLCVNGGHCYVEEKKYQFHLTGILSMTPSDYGGILNLLGADTATLLAEAVVIHYPNLKRTYQGVPVAAGLWGWGLLDPSDPAFGTPRSVGDRTSWGYAFDFSWTYDGKIIPGWQVTPEIFYMQAVHGRTPNIVGLFMQGAKSANFAVTFVQNASDWKVGVNLAKFWGGSSVLDQPLRSRDFFGLYVTRGF